jgi:hypothetical protein
MEEFSVVIMKRFRSNWFKETKGRLLSNIQKPLGIHHIRTILFSIPVNYLKQLRDFGLDKGGVDPFSPSMFSSWNSIKKAHHVDCAASRT